MIVSRKEVSIQLWADNQSVEIQEVINAQRNGNAYVLDMRVRCSRKETIELSLNSSCGCSFNSKKANEPQKKTFFFTMEIKSAKKCFFMESAKASFTTTGLAFKRMVSIQESTEMLTGL